MKILQILAWKLQFDSSFHVFVRESFPMILIYLSIHQCVTALLTLLIKTFSYSNHMVKDGKSDIESSFLFVIIHVPNEYIFVVLSVVVWLTIPAKYGATIIFAVSFFLACLTVPAPKCQCIKSYISKHLFESICKFIVFVCTLATIPKLQQCVRILFFTVVLCTWTTVPLSMLEWSLLRLTPTNMMEIVNCKMQAHVAKRKYKTFKGHGRRLAETIKQTGCKDCILFKMPMYISGSNCP